MEEALFTVLKIVNFILTAVVVVWGWRMFPDMRLRMQFGLMFLFFFLSTILFGEEGGRNEWTRHTLFYAGEIFFYLFLVNLIKRYYREDKPLGSGFVTTTGTYAAAAGGPALVSGSDGISWVTGMYEFLTEQGLQHLLTLPLIIIIIYSIDVRWTNMSKTLRGVVNPFVIAVIGLVAAHVFEFIIESQGFLPILDGEPVEYIEFGCYYFGLIFFAAGMYRLKRFISVQQIAA
ncbi:MAG: hypothetical protein AAB581_00550 [Patescibacteria group bacterium]